jgi:hypothetical protein
LSAPSQAPPVPEQSLADRDEAGVSSAPSPVLFRAVNEEMARIADNFELDEGIEFVCECDRGDCLHRLSVSRDAYEAVRRFPTRFLVKAEHVGVDDRIAEQAADYVVVEKVGGSAVSAIQFDPRRQAAREEPT